MNSKLFKYSIITSCLGLTLYSGRKLKDESLRMGIVGLLAQVSTDLVFHPLDLVNSRTKFYYAQNISTITTAKRIINSTGLKGFFRGGTVTLFGSSFGGFLYFALYKEIRDFIKYKLEGNENYFYVAYSLSSIISTFLTYCLYYPFELIKTRIITAQYAYKDIIDGVRKIMIKNNIIKSFGALYQGFTSAALLNSMGSCLTFFTFELCRDYVAGKRGISASEVAGKDYFICTFIAGVTSATLLNFLEVFAIQKMIHGKEVTLKKFLSGKNVRKILTSGLLARNLYGIFYTVFLLEFVKVFGKIYNVKL
jgi:hypothetical protein